MAEIPVPIKPYFEFSKGGYAELIVANDDGSYIDWVHLGGRAAWPNILNASTNGPIRILQRGEWGKSPIYYVTIDPPKGFRYLFPVSDTEIPEFTPEVLEKFLKHVGFNNGIISGHSFGGERMFEYLAWPQRTVKFQAGVAVAAHYNGWVKSLPKLEFNIKFVVAEKDGLAGQKPQLSGVTLSQTKQYQSLLQASGNIIETSIIEPGSAVHDIGSIYLNGPKKSVIFNWVAQQTKPVAPSLPKPVGDIYQENGKYWISLSDGRKAEVIF